MDLFISLTTIPSRFNDPSEFFFKVIQSLLDQTYAAKKIIVNIPFVSGKKDQFYDEEKIKKLSLMAPDIIVVQRNIDDVGPITKLYGALVTLQGYSGNAALQLADDDVIYAKDCSKNLFSNFMSKNASSAVGFVGRGVTQNIWSQKKNYFSFLGWLSKDINVLVLETFAGVIYPLQYFPSHHDFRKFIDEFTITQKMVDDIMIAYWCDQHNCPRMVVTCSSTSKSKPFVMGNDDALFLENIIRKNNFHVIKNLIENKGAFQKDIQNYSYSSLISYVSLMKQISMFSFSNPKIMLNVIKQMITKNEK